MLLFFLFRVGTFVVEAASVFPFKSLKMISLA